MVSIPQAVGTIAINNMLFLLLLNLFSFNTASGRYYCNAPSTGVDIQANRFDVSIPQAVGTIAMLPYGCGYGNERRVVSIPQAVGTIAIVSVHVSSEMGEDKVSIPQAVGTIAM